MGFGILQGLGIGLTIQVLTLIFHLRTYHPVLALTGRLDDLPDTSDKHEQAPLIIVCTLYCQRKN